MLGRAMLCYVGIAGPKGRTATNPLQYTNAMAEKGFYAVMFIVILGLMYWSISTGIEKHENMECQLWKEQSTQFAAWYATRWQVEQCQHYNVDLSVYEIK